ncbi:MAG: FliI/YscN family ATPase [Aquisalinus sp.]|nr:FliI/YscN family ATPase [Aquisalinus sp.]
MSDLEHTLARLQQRSTLKRVGHVTKALGTSVYVDGLDAEIGDICRVKNNHSGHEVNAEVIGIQKNSAILSLLGPIRGISVGAHVETIPGGSSVRVSEGLLGRVIDCNGDALDGGPPLHTGKLFPVYAEAPAPLSRIPINHRLDTGITAIDQFNPVGLGQRIGLFAKAGLGKSTLTSMIARNASADINVIALIGERGREVNDLIQESLGPEVLEKSVIVVSTSDRSAAERVKAANTATAIAEGFQQQGRNVLLIMDSITRYARALREMGLAAGEPPSRRGFPPSVFSHLPRLFERIGNGPVGSITAIYSVLIEDDEAEDPIAEEVKSLLDGHIFLSPELSAKGHFPAIDITVSVSRLATRLQNPPQQEIAREVKNLISKYKEIELLIQLGEYSAGNDQVADRAIALREPINEYLQQKVEDNIAFEDGYQRFKSLLSGQISLPPEPEAPVSSPTPQQSTEAALDEFKTLISGME